MSQEEGRRDRGTVPPGALVSGLRGVGGHPRACPCRLRPSAAAAWLRDLWQMVLSPPNLNFGIRNMAVKRLSSWISGGQ